MKKIRVEGDDEGVPSTSIREISLLKELKHENIVKLIDVSLEEEQLYLIFEFLSCDLKHYLDKKRREKTRLLPDQVKSYTYQILQVNFLAIRNKIIFSPRKIFNQGFKEVYFLSSDVLKIF